MHIIKKKNVLQHDLRNLLTGLLKEQFNIRLQIAAGKLKKTHLVKQVRKKIARVKTLLTNRIKN
ncbi:50S ribosomal protein L29 [Buchnera aphidicola]|uniref:50S ribosomal protein L29 n=1 Tax=Buchnera aphidicola TaxID=9 RepID=UPI00094C6661|nr:50S ribosomal protein L29 [Buchnera aphidicola]